MTEATVDSTTVVYTYAGDDLRATRDDGTTTTDYLWDRIGGLPQLVSDGTTDYVWGADGLGAEIDATGDATTPLLDLLGSVRLRTDDTATVIGSSDFEVFGGLRAQFGAQSSLGWAGELRDADTGLTYLRARDYSPANGRFIQRDSVNPSGPGTQGYQRYAYANGNPATLVDPSGHNAGYVNWQISVSLAGSAVFGATGGFGIVAAGEVGAVLGIGAFAVIGLGLIALILSVILLVVAMQMWCYELGCTMPDFSVDGLMRGRTVAGRTDVTMSLGGVGAAAACAASLGPLSPLLNKTTILSACPKLPRPDGDCATKAIIDAGPDIVVNNIPGTGGAVETGKDLADAGISVFQAYKDCKEGKSRNPWRPTREGTKDVLRCGKFGRFYQSVSDELWWSKDLAGHGGSVWKVFKQEGNALIWQFDADEYGNNIGDKHKGPTGKNISLKDCRRVEFVEP